MPELPEVESIVREVRRQAAGAVIREAVVHRADFVRTATPNLEHLLRLRRVEGVVREGKRIRLEFENGSCLLIHLGMSGRITFQASSDPTAVHTHFILRFKDRPFEFRLRDPRRFGGIWYYASRQTAIDGQAVLGPDALTITAARFAQICRRNRQIKALLMDQSAISGLGNIYCDEALFAAGIHPLAPANQLDRAAVVRLVKAIRAVLRRAIHSGGSSLRDYVRADGRPGGFQRLHRVYGREGKPCVRCGAPIARMVIAGRSTHFCESCQIIGITRAVANRSARQPRRAGGDAARRSRRRR